MLRREFLQTTGSALALSALPSHIRASASDAPRIDMNNYILGTQTIAGAYSFSDRTRLVETAERIADMGSSILKFSMSPRYSGDHYHLPKRDKIRSLTDLAVHEPSVKSVLDMPFAYYHIWAYPFSQPEGVFRDGLSDTTRKQVYEEMHALAVHLLKTYRGTGKTFLLGHWEGDWHLLGGTNPKLEPTPQAINAMIDWLNVRQQAIDEAKQQVKADGVELYHYTEVNLVRKGIGGAKCLVSDVLPDTAVDYVSYSCYDSLGGDGEGIRRVLRESLDHIESRLPAKQGFDTKRVFIGEYGFPLTRVGTPARQNAESVNVCLAALAWGCPFVLYWQMYCNEVRDGKHRGFWLIDDKNQKQPFYHTMQNFLRAMTRYAADFEDRHRRRPTDAEMRQQAVTSLRSTSSE